MNKEEVNQKLYDHIHRFFKGHKITRTTWNKGPILKAFPDFCVYKIAPVLWLLPITQEERDFQIENGLDALEEQFEEKGLEYWNPARASVI